MSFVFFTATQPTAIVTDCHTLSHHYSPPISGGLLLPLSLAVAAPLITPAAAHQSELEQLERTLVEYRAAAEALQAATAALTAEIEELRAKSIATARRAQDFERELTAAERTLEDHGAGEENGRESSRERVCPYV